MKIIKRRLRSYNEALNFMRENELSEFYYYGGVKVIRKDDDTLYVVYDNGDEVDYRTYIAFYEALALIE